MNGPLKVDNPITSKVDKYKMRALTLCRIKQGLDFRILGSMFNNNCL